jgi:hypothetical protein
MPDQMKIQVGIPPMRTILFRELPTGGESESERDGTGMNRWSAKSGKEAYYCQHVFFTVNAVSWMERAQPTVGVCTLNL